MLTAQGLAYSGRAKGELDSFIKLTRHFSEAWMNGETEVAQDEFSAILGVTSEAADRVALIMRTEGLVAHLARSGDDGTFWAPAVNSVFRFRNIESIESYLHTVAEMVGQPAALVPVSPQGSVDAASDGSDVEECEAALSSEAKRGFVLMPFDLALGWLHTVIRLSGAKAGVRMKRADDISSPGVLLDQITDAIDEADVVVAVCTGRNPNVFFEMGYAWRDHNVILVAADSSDLSFDVRHYRTVLYAGGNAGEDKASFESRLRQAIASVALVELLPRGRRLDHAPLVKEVVRLVARFENRGGGKSRLILTNSGTVPVYDLDISIPGDVGGFRLVKVDLPIKCLRPGESIGLLAMSTMGGGPSVFDVSVTGHTEDGERVEELSTISLYGQGWT